MEGTAHTPERAAVLLNIATLLKNPMNPMASTKHEWEVCLVKVMEHSGRQ